MRKRYRGERPPGLFSFDRGLPVDQYDQVDNARLRRCTWCGAAPYQPCTTNGRPRKNGTYHPARLAAGPAGEPHDTPHDEEPHDQDDDHQPRES